MNKNPTTGLSRDFVIRSIMNLFDEVESQKQWGAVSVVFQAGVFKNIRKEETINSEDELEQRSLRQS